MSPGSTGPGFGRSGSVTGGILGGGMGMGLVKGGAFRA
jgi:hypothetical protein